MIERITNTNVFYQIHTNSTFGEKFGNHRPPINVKHPDRCPITDQPACYELEDAKRVLAQAKIDFPDAGFFIVIRQVVDLVTKHVE